MFPLRDKIPSKTFPFITVSLIVINLVVFFYELSLGQQLNSFLNTFSIIPSQFNEAINQPSIQIFPIGFTLFSSVFLHGGWMHVIGNMWYLWIFGDNVEDSTGHFRFLIFYLLCGILAGITHILLNPFSTVPTIGASGAIAGVMGAYFLLFPKSKILTLIFIFIFIQIIEIPAVFFLGFWIILQFISGSMSRGLVDSGGGVAWWAHIGGFLVGVTLILLFKKRKK